MNRRLSTKAEWALWVLFGLVVLLGSTTAAYAAYFSSHALPGVSIAGTSVTGQTEQEVASTVADRAGQVVVDVALDGRSSQLSLAELGVTVDAEATAAQAFAPNGEVGARVSALANSRDVPVVVVQDDSVAQEVVARLVADVGVPAQNARVSLSQDATSFVVTASVAGRSVDPEALLVAAVRAAETLTSQDVILSTAQIEPTVTTEQAQRVADAANSLVSLDISIIGREATHAPTPAEKVRWLSIPADDSGIGEPVIDRATVSAWVSAVSESTTVEPVPGVRNVNSRGDVVSTPVEGVKGWRVNNAAALDEALANALQSGTAFSGEFRYDEIEPTYETRVIATGAENLVYQAAPNQKWIDLNLSNNTVTSYVGATVAAGPVYIVPGMPGMETPTGTFNVYLKYQMQTMRGTNLDGTPYVAPDIPWVTYFTGSIAFHGAPWRDSFGWSGPGGSHGCVNMPSDAAKFIYDWAPMGTVVVSHY